MNTELPKSWTFYEQRIINSNENFSDLIFKLGDVKTIKEFLSYFYCIPPPSKLFTTETEYRRFKDRKVNGWSFFRQGIKPEWEDPKNINGCEIFFRKNLRLEDLDTIWSEVLNTIITPEFEKVEKEYNVTVTGCRIIDKSSNSKLLYKFEMWFEENDKKSIKNFEKRFKKEIQLFSNINFEFKYHSS